MTGLPVVSVITPTKNRLRLLCETMDSVAAQSFDAWEHLIVDDGSDDGTAEEVARRAAADLRIRYIQRTGGKPGANVCRNLGISQSQADLIIFLDSDDLLAPGSLARRVAVMERNEDLDFVTFQTGVFQNTPGDLGRQLDPELIGDDLLRFLFLECPWQTTAPTWRRSALDRLGGFDESMLSWQDVDLHIRAVAGHMKYLRFPEVDHHMRWVQDSCRTSALQRSSPQHLKAAQAILEKFEDVVWVSAGMNWVRQRALCSLYFFVSENWVRSGDLWSALGAWQNVRTRKLGGPALTVMGSWMLIIRRAFPNSDLAERLVNKWKGWMRLRTNPALLKKSRDRD
jgi:GT2 family glycosyltransferase